MCASVVDKYGKCVFDRDREQVPFVAIPCTIGLGLVNVVLEFKMAPMSLR